MNSDTGSRTPSCRVRGGNVSRYTISDSGFYNFWDVFVTVSTLSMAPFPSCERDRAVFLGPK